MSSVTPIDVKVAYLNHNHRHPTRKREYDAKGYDLAKKRPFEQSQYAPVYPNIVNIMKYDPNQLMVLEDEDVTYLYEIIQGTVINYKILSDGRRLITDFLTKGDMVGFPYDAKHFHSTETITATTVCCHKKEQIADLMASNSTLSQKIFKLTSDQLRNTHEQLITLGRKTPDERVATFLLYSQKWANKKIISRRPIIDLPMSRIDIADYLGLTQETVCRVFSKFRRAGLITMPHSNQIILDNMGKLLEYSEKK